MLTLVVSGRKPLLGTLAGGENDAHVVLSPLGEAIFCKEVLKIEHYYPMVEVWKCCVMPDHIHLILNVKEKLPLARHLGHVVGGFKTGCSRAWRCLMHSPCADAQGTQPVSGPVLAASAASLLFEPGYNDKILYHRGQLGNWKRYLDDNPRRLMLKRLNPTLFHVVCNANVAGRECQMIGNRFLLDIPDKVAVIIHHNYSLDECRQLCRQWFAVGENGGVLVGTAIAPLEKNLNSATL